MTDIRAIRQKLGLSQKEMADELGHHQSAISKMETGKQVVDPRTAKLCAVLLREFDTQALPQKSEAA